MSKLFRRVVLHLVIIFVECILNQPKCYFMTKDILVPNEYGFRSGSTTTDFSVELMDEIIKALGEEKYAISIFLDLSKALNTVNNSILLSKLHSYGIRSNENQWFKYYLSKRKQKVFVNGIESSSVLISNVLKTWQHKCASQKEQNVTLCIVAIATLTAPVSLCQKTKYPHL